MMSYGDVVNNNGILEFASVEDLRTTIAALYNNQEYNIENYQKNFSGMTVDQFIEQAKADGWDENNTFVEFESQLNFTSQRPDYENKMEAWGENGLNPANDPDQDYFSTAYPVLSILNPNSAVGVAGKLYKFMKNGVIYEITDGNRTTLNQITDINQKEAFVASNVVTLNPELLGTGKTAATCYTKASTFMNYGHIDNEHVQDKIQLVNAGFLFSFCEAKMINWRRKNNGSYTRQSRRMDAGIYNKTYEVCSPSYQFIPNKKVGWRIVDTRTAVQVTVFHNQSYQAQLGALFTNSDLEYYGKYFHWNTLLK